MAIKGQRKPWLSERNTTHGLSRKCKTEYLSWKDMRRRCRSASSQDYGLYGGRGIKICPQWSDFAVFFADMGCRPPGHTLERLNVNGDYEPRNCIWADAKTQANNKRSNHFIDHKGARKTLAQWCELYGVDHSKARYRLSRGWSFELVFDPANHRGKNAAIPNS